jgi:hypothetical protein
VDFSSITPEMIIGPQQASTDDEKQRSWHFHIRAHSVHACVTGIDGADEAEAEGNALGEFLPRFERDREDWSVAEIFGNERWTYCATPDCGGCDLEVHVTRMQDGRQAVAPRVLIFDLI